MSASENSNRDGNFALNDDGEQIVPQGNWRCDHYRHCGCVGYLTDPVNKGTCRSGSCTHAAYEHNE